MAKCALITGITGQDGSYLAELLLSKGYIVHGTKRRSSSFNTGRIDAIFPDFHDRDARLFLHFADLADSTSLIKLLYRLQPDEIYHLGAQSHVRVSFDIPEYTGDITAVGTTRILEAIRETGLKTKFYQASSSEMFGRVVEVPQREATPFRPCSPYACAKVYAYWMAVNHREGYGLFACNGILFNHEGPRRGETFVTRKITQAVAAIHLGKQECLYLGNLNAQRDWGHARDFAEGMWLVLQQPEPDDYVLATGESHSVREFVELAFAEVGITIQWQRAGAKECGLCKKTKRKLVQVDPRYFRPTEVEMLCGNPAKARAKLGWKHRVEFRELVCEMMADDLKLISGRPDNDLKIDRS